METTRMSQKEMRAAEAVAKVNAKTMKAAEAAASLGVTDRTARRMKAKVREGGAAALAHGGRGRPGNRRMPRAELRRTEGLLKMRYPDFGPGLAAEKLREGHGIVRDPKTVRAAMISLGLWKPRRGRKAEHRPWRERRARLGEPVQYDGSYHRWLEGRGGTGELCLLAAIDDATGTVPRAVIAGHEGVLPTLGFWRGYAERRGLPEAVYLDRFSTYRVNGGVAAENQDARTQFGRVMASLGVRVVFAMSPQAKGRVERLFGTLQDRLVKELRLRGGRHGRGGQPLRQGGVPAGLQPALRARGAGGRRPPPAPDGGRATPRRQDLLPRGLADAHQRLHGPAREAVVPAPAVAPPRHAAQGQGLREDGAGRDGDALGVGEARQLPRRRQGASVGGRRLNRPTRTFLIPARPDISISR